MPEELPDIIPEIGEIKLEPGIPFYYAAWGIRYKFREGGWRIVNMVFNKKSDAEVWMKQKYLKFEDMKAEVIPVKHTLYIDRNGNIKSETEELVDD